MDHGAARAPVPASSLDELTAGAVDLGPVPGTDGKSGSPLRRLRRGDEPLVLKGQSRRHDWTIRVMGDDRYAGHRLLRSPLLAAVPDVIDHTIVGFTLAQDGPEPDDWCLWTLMRDVGPWLVPEGDGPLARRDDEAFLRHMAALHARFWGGTDELDLVRMSDRLRSFSPAVLDRELAREPTLDVPAIARGGWRRLAERDPALWHLLAGVHDDVSPLVDALAATPTTFLHGDWKLGNLGRHDDGRTILIDWTYPGFGPALVDLGWYLALNSARLSMPKEEAVDRYRQALEDEGVATDGWFERQLALSLLGLTAMFGWEKALGDEDELRWWAARARAGREQLG